MNPHDLPKLDKLQIGHIRHIQNLARQLPGDWSHMDIDDRKGSGGTRFQQVAHMCYALALAHYHRLPNAPVVFRASMEQLIDKMLRHDCWGYWEDLSTSGKEYDPDIVELRKPWMDPIERENIMYSGRLGMMLGLYANLFNDDKYAAPDALRLTYRFPHNGGPRVFQYDYNKICDVIYWQIVESGYLGVPCEPNQVFLVCNQYAMIALRMRDARNGTDTAAQVTAAYRAAWAQKNWLNDEGHLIVLYRPNQGSKVERGLLSCWDAYTGTYMNSWNGDFVRSLYPAGFRYAYRHHEDGTICPWPVNDLPAVKAAMDAGASASSLSAEAKEGGVHIGQFDQQREGAAFNDFGFHVAFVSEMGDQAMLDGLLAYADKHMNPTWRNGGLFYPRNDTFSDAQGNITFMDPWTGNALIAHARLNVRDGLKQLYEQPWTERHFCEPMLTRISPELDVLRAIYLPDTQSLVVTVNPTRANAEAAFSIDVGGLNERPWKMLNHGECIGDNDRGLSGSAANVDCVTDGSNIHVSGPLDRETTFEFRWQ